MLPGRDLETFAMLYLQYTSTLQSREELRVNQSRFHISQFGSCIACKAEVGILENARWIAFYILQVSWMSKPANYEVQDVGWHANGDYLVNRTRNQTRNIGTVAEDVGERIWEGRCSLDSGKRKFASVVRVREPKRRPNLSCMYYWQTGLHKANAERVHPYLIEREWFLESADVGIHGPNVLQVWKNERFVDIKPAGYDILGVLQTQIICFM